MADSVRRLFGDYELLEEIAHGGMGVVYRARQLKLNRVVALKLILSGRFARRDSVQRFRGEAAAAGVLQHPNIVAIHEIGMHEGQHFFSMDYVAGQNLAQVVENRPLPALKAAKYVKVIAQAIHYAHEQGILHRDLKPSNVLIETATDQPRVTDFGLAKWLEGESSLTMSGQVLGSPNFMPPEQAAGSGGRASRRSDVYGLGGILYFLLTARAPFQGETLEAILHQALHVEPIAPRLLNSGVPADLQTICLKCLEKDPAKRYGTAQELADDLGRFLNDEPVHARPVGQTQKFWRWCRRKPALATLGAMVLVLLIVVIIGAPIMVLRIDRARAELEKSLYAADMRSASEALRNGAIEQVQGLLKAHVPGKRARDLRGFEWRYLQHAIDQSDLLTHQLQGLKGTEPFPYSDLAVLGDTVYNFLPVSGQIIAWDRTSWAALPLKAPALRASERWWLRPEQQAALAINDMDHKITVYRLPGFEEVSLVQVPGKALEAAVSGDLGTLAVAFKEGGVHRILVWDLAANSQRGVLGEYRGTVTRLGFSPDGQVLMAACDNGEIGLWSIAQGKALPSPDRDSSNPQEDWQQPLFFGPRSTRLYLNRGRERKVVEVWDWITGKLSILHQAHAGGAFAFSADGAVLAIAGSDGNIALFDTQESRQIGTMPANGAFIISLDFSPTGSLLASGSEDRCAKLWDVKTQRELAPLGGNDDKVNQVAFTPDGNSLITLIGDGKIKVWNVDAVLKKRGVLWRTTESIERFEVSADERTIATKDSAGRIHICDLATGSEIRRVHAGEPDSMAFSPRDHILAWGGWNSTGILDYESGQTNTFSLPRYGFCQPAFSPDGREIAFAGPTNIVIWDRPTRKLRPFAEAESTVFSLAFSADGSLLASAHRGGTLTLWDRASGRETTKVLDGQPPDAFDIGFSPDGRLLASGGSDGTGRLWDVVPGGLKLRHTLGGHVGIVNLFFSPDGRRVVSKSRDSILKLWDTETGLEVGRLYGHRGRVLGVAFSRDGNSIYSAAEDGDVRIWQAPPLERLQLSESAGPSRLAMPNPNATKKGPSL
jgi:WD40 repeat protein/tRNA A-37 threonylcarbamoyl transferase component Bud32